MINKTKNSEKKSALIEEAIAQLVESGHHHIKADTPEWESPSRMVNRNSGLEFTPDITAQIHGAKVYAEVAQRTEDERKLVTKWRLLETIAKMKQGNFKVFVPRGHLKFTRDLLTRYDMQPEVVKMF